MSHLSLVSISSELPPPIPHEAIAAGAIDSVFGDLFTPQRKIPAPAPQKPALAQFEADIASLPPALRLRFEAAMREQQKDTPPPMPREAGHIPFEYQGRPRRRFTRTQEPRIISARFPSRCSETGAPILTGESILWNPMTKQVFCESSDAYRERHQ